MLDVMAHDPLCKPEDAAALVNAIIHYSEMLVKRNTFTTDAKTHIEATHRIFPITKKIEEPTEKTLSDLCEVRRKKLYARNIFVDRCSGSSARRGILVSIIRVAFR